MAKYKSQETNLFTVYCDTGSFCRIYILHTMCAIPKSKCQEEEGEKKNVDTQHITSNRTDIAEEANG